MVEAGGFLRQLHAEVDLLLAGGGGDELRVLSNEILGHPRRALLFDIHLSHSFFSFGNERGGVVGGGNGLLRNCVHGDHGGETRCEDSHGERSISNARPARSVLQFSYY